MPRSTGSRDGGMLCSDQRSESSSEAGYDAGLFDEPDDFRPKSPPPTKASYTLRADTEGEGREARIELQLVGSHPLWGHHLWNAAPTLSDYLSDCSARSKNSVSHPVKEASREATQRPLTCAGKAVLELGAASGLPSIVAQHLDAHVVVSTDYPDADLMRNLEHNLEANRSHLCAGALLAKGYLWGSDTMAIRSALGDGHNHYDIVLMSDLIFNHQAHDAMLDTLDQCLPAAGGHSAGCAQQSALDAQDYDGPQALVFFTHHRPHLADRDLQFFASARKRGWTATEIATWKMAPMFPDDPGSAEVRATVHGWRLAR